jgi:hypothetical protein
MPDPFLTNLVWRRVSQYLDIIESSLEKLRLSLGSAWAGRTDALCRRSVRAAAVSPPFPLGEVLPSTASAEGKPSLFGRGSKPHCMV